MINTEKLRQLVARALDDDRAEWDREQDAADAAEAKHQEKWVQENSAEWYNAARLIQERVDARQPITKKDLPLGGSWGDSVRVFEPLRRDPRHKAGAQYVPPAELVQFQQFLEIVEGDTLTTGSLKTHGFANLQNRILNFVREASR